MTTDQKPQQEPQETQDGPEPTEDQQEPQDGQGEPSKSREAARYRVKLRETEDERDQLSQEVTELREQLERFHTGKLTEAVGGRTNLAALRGLGADLTGIVREDGTVDTERARALLKEHELTPKVGGYIPASGTGVLGPNGAGPTWADAIRERNR